MPAASEGWRATSSARSRPMPCAAIRRARTEAATQEGFTTRRAGDRRPRATSAPRRAAATSPIRATSRSASSAMRASSACTLRSRAAATRRAPPRPCRAPSSRMRAASSRPGDDRPLGLRLGRRRRSRSPRPRSRRRPRRREATRRPAPPPGARARRALLPAGPAAPRAGETAGEDRRAEPLQATMPPLGVARNGGRRWPRSRWARATGFTPSRHRPPPSSRHDHPAQRDVASAPQLVGTPDDDREEGTTCRCSSARPCLSASATHRA